MAPSVNGHGQDHGLINYESFSANKKKAGFHFLVWCAGADQGLIKESPSEQTKYAGLGGIVLATFVLASLSAGYAIYSVFDDKLWAIGFALVWGLIIFNFDRFLVSTMRKYGVSTSKQIWMTAPRIALALLISITIARPLELKIFEKEINVKVFENRHKKVLKNDSLLLVENSRVLAGAEQERARLINRKTFLENELNRQQKDYIQEADGTGGSGQKGIERLTLLKEEAFQHSFTQLTPEINLLASAIGHQDSILGGAKANMEEKRRRYESTMVNQVGFLERNKALSDLANEENSIFLAIFFIGLLIVLIETGPIFSKLIMPLGPYDLALSKKELLEMAASEQEIRREKALMHDKMDEIYKRKKEVSEELMDKITGLQKKYMNEEMNKWERSDQPGKSRFSMDELTRKIKEQFDFSENHVL